MKKLRTYAIADYLKEKKYCSLRELIEHFQVSPATMYRDIADLASRGVIKKVHGGIAWQDTLSGRNRNTDSSQFLIFTVPIYPLLKL